MHMHKKGASLGEDFADDVNEVLVKLKPHWVSNPRGFVSWPGTNTPKECEKRSFLGLPICFLCEVPTALYLSWLSLLFAFFGRPLDWALTRNKAMPPQEILTGEGQKNKECSSETLVSHHHINNNILFPLCLTQPFWNKRNQSIWIDDIDTYRSSIKVYG